MSTIPIREVHPQAANIPVHGPSDADRQKGDILHKVPAELAGAHHTLDYIWDWPNACSLFSGMLGVLSIRYALNYEFKIAAGLLLFGVAFDWLDGWMAHRALPRRMAPLRTFGTVLDNTKDIILTLAGPLSLLFALTPNSFIDTIVGLFYSSMVLLRTTKIANDKYPEPLIQRGLSADKNVILLGLLWSFFGYISTPMLLWLVRLTMLTCGLMNVLNFPNAKIPPVQGTWFWGMFLACLTLGFSAMC